MASGLCRSVISTLCCLGIGLPSNAAETDQYMTWGITLKDSKKVINSYLNKEISEVIAKSNKKRRKRSCIALSKRIGLHFGGAIEFRTKLWADKNKDIEIYPPRSVDQRSYFAMSVYADRHFLRLAPTMNINGVYLGTDKFSHAISLGYVYYLFYLKRYERALKKHVHSVADDMAQRSVIDFGIGTEKTMLGGWSTGERSYADLEANYQGFRFHYDMCHGTNPALVKDGNGGWQLARPLDFSKYVNPHWDESYYPNVHEERFWPQLKERMIAYCYKRHQPIVQKRFAYYDSIAKDSFNLKVLREKIRAAKLADPAPQDFRNFCPAMGL